MNRHGLRTRILIYSVLPLLLIGLATISYFLINNYTRLNNNIINHGKMILSPLATSLSYAMSQKDETLAQGLINEFHRLNSRDIIAISVFDSDNNILVTSSVAFEINKFRLDPLKNEYIYEAESVQFTDNGIIMRMPIYSYNEAQMLKLYLDKDTVQYSDDSTPQPAYTNSKINYPRHVAGYVCIYLNTQQTVLDMYSSIAIALIILGLGVLFSLLFGINLNHIIVDPINRLSTTIYEIREGNVNTKVNGIMHGELERLRNYINSMADSMSEYHNQMQYSIDEATNDLRKTLNLLDEQNKELDSALYQANEASKIKSEFLANMSHELRTPLNGIIGFAQQLYKTPLKTNQTDYLQTIERSAKNLLSIVNNILDFSKLEAGKLSFEEIPFSLRKACYETVNLLTPTVYQKGIELTVNIDPDVHDYVIGDPIRVGQILTNLLGNAIKFTKNGNVALKISRAELQGIPFSKINLSVSVQDTGIGIEPDKQNVLFKPFTQADSSISRRYGGTGLGLIITSHLIEQMGGKITLHSEPGQGTTFTFNIILNKGISPVINIKSPEEKALAHNKVVVIENNTWVRDSIKSLLSELNMDVITISTTGAINALASADNPKYIIIGQPSNFEFNRLLTIFNSINLNQVTKVIIAVNTMDEKVHRELLNLSPKVAVLVKPLTTAKIVEAMTRTSESTGTKQDDNTADKKTPDTNTNSGSTPALENRNTGHETSDRKDNAPEVGNLIPASILAVDDNPINLSLIKALLKDIVTDVYTAIDGNDAIEKCMHTEFDLIFMDIQMPIMDGVTTMKNIKKTPTNKDTPVVAVTALVVKEEQERFIREGMADYMAKPLDEKILLDMIHKYCGSKAVSLQITSASQTGGDNTGTEKINSVQEDNKKTTDDKKKKHKRIKVIDSRKNDDNSRKTDASGKSEQNAPKTAQNNTTRNTTQSGSLKSTASSVDSRTGAGTAGSSVKKSAPEGAKSISNSAQSGSQNSNVLWTVDDALKMAAGKQPLAVEMLEGLYASIPEFEKNYQKLKDKNTPDLARVIHKFAGSAVYCGMPKVKALCNTIESMLKEGTDVSDIEPEMLELEDMLNIIKANKNNWLNSLKSQKK